MVYSNNNNKIIIKSLSLGKLFCLPKIKGMHIMQGVHLIVYLYLLFLAVLSGLKLGC